MIDAWWDLVHGSSCCACGRPGRPLCPECAIRLPTAAVAVRPDPPPTGLAPCFAAGPYAEPLRTMILRHKEHGAHGLARHLGGVLGAVVEDLVAAVGEDCTAVLVPIPSAATTVRTRGHDPMLRITRVAAAAVRRTHPAVVARLLRLRQPVADQAGLDSVARARNLHETMATRPGARCWLSRRDARGGRRLVLVCDDVLTTGATAREAQRAMEDAGVRCDAVVTIAATRRRRPSAAAGPVQLPRRLPESGAAD